MTVPAGIGRDATGVGAELARTLGGGTGLSGDPRLCLFAQRIGHLHGEHSNWGSSYELLTRFQRQDGTPVSEALAAASFVPAVERQGLMTQLDRWVFEEALVAQGEAIRRSGMEVSINVSAQSLNDASFLQFFLDAMARSPLPAGQVLLEITETALVHDLPATSAVLGEIRALGCRVALDDFGVGSSSFDYLRSLPVDYLKIDGSFTRKLLDSPVDLAIVRSMQHLASELGIRTVMECVESEALLERARELGMDFVQGHAIGDPEPLEDLLLRRQESQATH